MRRHLRLGAVSSGGPRRPRSGNTRSKNPVLCLLELAALVGHRGIEPRLTMYKIAVLTNTRVPVY